MTPCSGLPGSKRIWSSQGLHWHDARVDKKNKRRHSIGICPRHRCTPDHTLALHCTGHRPSKEEGRQTEPQDAAPSAAKSPPGVFSAGAQDQSMVPALPFDACPGRSGFEPAQITSAIRRNCSEATAASAAHRPPLTRSMVMAA